MWREFMEAIFKSQKSLFDHQNSVMPFSSYIQHCQSKRKSAHFHDRRRNAR